MTKPKPLSERLFARVEVTPTCWLWTGPLWNGYGRMKVGGKAGRMIPVHRVSYELLAGPIPDGLTLDHLCRVRNCVNPAHLEPVPLGVNVLRGTAPAALNARLKVCKKAGHPLTPDNLTNDQAGHRRCKTCRDEYLRERYRRQRAARAERRMERAA